MQARCPHRASLSTGARAVKAPGTRFSTRPRGGAGVAEAVVEAVGAALPEFDGEGDDDVTAPAGRAGDGAGGKFILYGGQLLFQILAPGDGLALGEAQAVHWLASQRFWK